MCADGISDCHESKISQTHPFNKIGIFHLGALCQRVVLT